MVFWHLVKKMSLIRDNQSILNTLPTNWRTSWLGILDLEQQGLSAHGLKVVLSLILVQLPQQREVKKKNGKMGNCVILKLLLHPDLVGFSRI